MGSSQIRDWTQASCNGRRILYHWAVKEAQHLLPSAVYSSPGALVARRTTAMAWRKRAIAEMQVSRVLEVSELLSHSLRKVPSCCLSHTALPREERVTTMETERLWRALPGAWGKGRPRIFFKSTSLKLFQLQTSRLGRGEGGREGSLYLTIFRIPKEHDGIEREESRNQNTKMEAVSLTWCRIPSNDWATLSFIWQRAKGGLPGWSSHWESACQCRDMG